MSGPNIKAGGKVATPVLNIDIAPTLLDLAGVTTGAHRDMDGLSITPLVHNVTDDVSDLGDVHDADNEMLRVRRDSEVVMVNTTATASLAGAEPIINNYTGIQAGLNVFTG